MNQFDALLAIYKERSKNMGKAQAQYVKMVQEQDKSLDKFGELLVTLAQGNLVAPASMVYEPVLQDAVEEAAPVVPSKPKPVKPNVSAPSGMKMFVSLQKDCANCPVKADCDFVEKNKSRIVPECNLGELKQLLQQSGRFAIHVKMDSQYKYRMEVYKDGRFVGLLFQSNEQKPLFSILHKNANKQVIVDAAFVFVDAYVHSTYNKYFAEVVEILPLPVETTKDVVEDPAAAPVIKELPSSGGTEVPVFQMPVIHHDDDGEDELDMGPEATILNI